MTCRRWAEESDFGLAYELSPVGRTKGIGIALFPYLRMRAGGDDLKPDDRVIAALRSMGFPVASAMAAYVVGSAAALEIGSTRLELDQLLW